MKNKTYFNAIFLSLSCLFASAIANATVVEVRTSVGDFQVNLFDQTTPQTVANFLSYVNAGAYANNAVHRSSSNFVIQMGGYEYAPSTNSVPLSAIATGATVINEPELSSVRGTLGMAKLGGDPNSATSQFFVNLSNNASILDTQNGGFTVFGQVIGDGMDIVDQIAGLPTYNFGGSFTTLPLRNYTSADASNNVLPTDNSLIIISDIVVIDAAVSTNPTLNPARNTLINASQSGSGSSSGGGSLSVVFMLGLGLMSLRKRISFK